MPNEFTHDVFLSHSAKDKAVVRPLAERADKPNRRPPELQPSSFLLHPFPCAPLNKDRHFLPLRLDDAPIKGSLAQRTRIHPPR